MKNLIILIFTGLFIMACTQEKTKDSINSGQIAFANEKDPVCDMMVSEGVIDTALFKGSVYGFCSKDCKLKFSRKPEAYTFK